MMMNTVKKVAILALFCVMGMVGVNAQMLTKPNVVDSGHGAIPGHKARPGSPLAFAEGGTIGGEVVAGPNMVVTVTPLFGPFSGAARDAFMASAINLGETHAIPSGARTSNTDVRRMDMWIVEDVIRSISTPFYRGIFNPTAPFENARGGTTWWLVDATAAQGQTVALADISRAEISGNDIVPGVATNILGRTFTFTAGDAYGIGAVGINANGSRIPSGTSAIQQAARVIVLVGTPAFTAETEAQYQEIKNYESAVPNWALTATVTVQGAANPVVVTLDKTPDVALPRLFPIVIGTDFIVRAETNGNTGNFPIQLSSTVGAGSVWSNAGMIRAGQSVTNAIGVGDRARFARYTPNP